MKKITHLFAPMFALVLIVSSCSTLPEDPREWKEDSGKNTSYASGWVAKPGKVLGTTPNPRYISTTKPPRIQKPAQVL